MQYFQPSFLQKMPNPCRLIIHLVEGERIADNSTLTAEVELQMNDDFPIGSIQMKISQKNPLSLSSLSLASSLRTSMPG